MTKTAVAGDDRDRELAALRAEVAALRQEVAMLRAVKLGSDAPAGWQRVIYPQTTLPWINACAGAAGHGSYIVSQVYQKTAGCAEGYAGQVFTIPVG